MCDQCDKYKAEIFALETRVEELEEQIPGELYSETRRTMMEDYDWWSTG